MRDELKFIAFISVFDVWRPHGNLAVDIVSKLATWLDVVTTNELCFHNTQLVQQLNRDGLIRRFGARDQCWHEFLYCLLPSRRARGHIQCRDTRVDVYY